MSRKVSLLVGVAVLAGVCAIVACTVGVGGGRAFVAFTIGGETFIIELGSLTPFRVVAAGAPVRQAAAVPLFTQTPADRPTTGRLNLNANRVQAVPLAVGKVQTAEQGVTGTATVQVFIAGASSTAPCDEGTEVGSFELVFAGATVTVTNPSLDVPPAALAEMITGAFTICISVTATIDVSITIGSMDVVFGPSHGVPDNVNDNEAADNVNENEAEPDVYTLSVIVDGQGSVELSPPGGSYTSGTEVTLTATADAGWTFVSWGGDLSGSDNPATIVMNADKAVTAVLEVDTVFDTAADFEQGTLVGLEFDEEAGGLTISGESTTLPFIWVPNSNEGTISKVDTQTGDERGRYRVCPETVFGNPSRTTVDLWGSCYVANRESGTLVKVGLYENGGYDDRNGNGIIETSQDLNGDGDITSDELLDWGEDECVLWEVVLTTADEGPYEPGTYPGTYPSGYWNPGTRGVAVDANNDVWAGVYGTGTYYHIDGETGSIINTVDASALAHNPYGAVVDPNGIIWSSSWSSWHVLKIDTADYSFSMLDLPHQSYGLAVDRNNHLFVTGRDQHQMSRINILTDAIEWTVPAKYSRGIALTADGNLWTADSQDGTVTRWTNDGAEIQAIPVGWDPTGVAVDADGYVWVVNNGDTYVKRINPATNTVDIEKSLIGTTHYGYSDMTGIVARSVSTQIGNWTVDYGATDLGALWDNVAWGGQEPVGTVISVRVRSSDDLLTWSDWVTVTSGMTLTGLPGGRYLQIEATLQILTGDDSPVLSYVEVFTVE